MSLDDRKKKRLKDILKMLLFFGIGVFFIYWFLLKLDSQQKHDIWQAFIGANFWWVVACMICSLLSHIVRALRWQLLYRPIGYKPSINSTFGSVMVAYLANLAFPRAGEVMRCVTMRTSEGIAVEKSLGTVVTERVIDFLFFVVIVVVGLLAMFGQAKDWLYDTLSEKYSNIPNMWVMLGVLVGVLVVIVVLYLLFYKRLRKFSIVKKVEQLLYNMLDGVKSIFHLGVKNMALFIVYSLAVYALYILGGLIIFKAFGETFSLGMGAAFTVYLFGSVGMTFSQGGIGVYPVLVQMALAIYGISVEVGTACGWLLWGSQQAVVIVIGAAYLVMFSIKKRKISQ